MSKGATTPMRHACHSLNSRGPAATACSLRDGIGRTALAVLLMGCGLAASAGPAAPKCIAAGKPEAPGEISWSVPEDGGTPRDPRRIEALGPLEFRVRAAVEEGQSVLKHAVSRVDLT